ncbi:MAG: hypothetical protein ACRC6V_05945 [Bacteroidales bacterium]
MHRVRLEGIKYKVDSLMEGGDLSFIFTEIKNRIANEIVETTPEDSGKRDDLYQLARGIKALEVELQGYVNDICRIKEKD